MKNGLPVSTCVLLVAASFGIVACGSSDPADSGSGEITKTVEMTAVDFAFRADEAITIVAGDTVEFRVRNEGAVDHQMEVLTAANRRLGMTDRIAPGQTATVTATFDEPGTYQVFCDIDNHRSLGQVATFEVSVAP